MNQVEQVEQSQVETSEFKYPWFSFMADPEAVPVDQLKVYMERTKQKLVIVRGVLVPDSATNIEPDSHQYFSVLMVDNNPAEHYNAYPSSVIASAVDFDTAVELVNKYNPEEKEI